MTGSRGWSSARRGTRPSWVARAPGTAQSPVCVVLTCGWVLVASLVVLLPFAIVYRETGELPLRPDDEPDPLGLFLYVGGVPALIAIVCVTVVLARTAPDLIRREVLEGTVESRERVLYGVHPSGGNRPGYNYYLDVVGPVPPQTRDRPPRARRAGPAGPAVKRGAEAATGTAGHRSGAGLAVARASYHRWP